MNIRGVDFIAYWVSDLKRSAEFYRETLGLTQEVYREDWFWAEFNAGNVTLTLYERDPEKMPSSDVPQQHVGGQIALAVEDIQAAYRELSEKGVEMRGEPYELTYCKHLEIYDPDRNLIIIHERKDGSFGNESGSNSPENGD